ncbi:hypothetical protein Tco_1132848 [Tanacetum coccineum]|uniref:Uncharacterized protein n=1 Tax=Tanacetum coccineum TaxID=301880 RepID=A0ABQ5JD22_9ASTR
MGIHFFSKFWYIGIYLQVIRTIATEFRVVKLAREFKGLDVISNSYELPRQRQEGNALSWISDLCFKTRTSEQFVCANDNDASRIVADFSLHPPDTNIQQALMKEAGVLVLLTLQISDVAPFNDKIGMLLLGEAEFSKLRKKASMMNAIQDMLHDTLARES